jgi:hypothetical protein
MLDHRKEELGRNNSGGTKTQIAYGLAEVIQGRLDGCIIG